MATDDCLADTSAQLELFSGDVGCLPVNEWLQRLEISKEIGEWSNRRLQSVLLNKLTGSARRWHMATGIHIDDFAEWKLRFAAKFAEDLSIGTAAAAAAAAGGEVPYDEENVLNERRRIRSNENRTKLHEYLWRSAVLVSQLQMTPDDAKSQILSGLPVKLKYVERELRNRRYTSVVDVLLDIEKTVRFAESLSNLRDVIEYKVNLRWIPGFGGTKPDNAVFAGHDSDQEPLYVARAYHDCDLIPGKLKQTHQRCYIPCDGREIGYASYEVLVANCPVRWVACKSSMERLPPGAIEGGHHSGREPYYIGRANHRDSVTCGRVCWLTKTCFVSWDSREWPYDEFEVLTCSAIELADN